jgi:hypothetical protein
MPYFSTLFLLKKWGIIVHLLLFLPKKSVFLLNKSEEKGHNCTFIAISSENLFFYYVYTQYILHKRIYLLLHQPRAYARERKRFFDFFCKVGRSLKRKRKSCAKKKKRKPTKRKLPCRLRV